MCPEGALDVRLGQQETPEDGEEQDVAIAQPGEQKSGHTFNTFITYSNIIQCEVYVEPVRL